MERHPKRLVEIGGFLHIGLQCQHLRRLRFDKISLDSKGAFEGIYCKK